MMKSEEYCEYFYMWQISPSDTGIDNIVMFLSMESVEGKLHGPWLRISNTPNKLDITNYYAVSISNNPVIECGEPKISIETQKQIIEWIKLNLDLLINMWNDVYDDVFDFFDNLIKINNHHTI